MYTVLLLFLYYEDESIEFLEKNIALISIFVMDKAYSSYIQLMSCYLQYFSYIVVISFIGGETRVL